MNQRRSIFFLLAICVLLIIAISGVAWANLRYSADYPGGVGFLTYWEGARSLLTEGDSPYSSLTQDRIQEKAADLGIEDAYPELRPTYPLFALIPFLPFASVSDYNLARALWMGLLEIALVGLVALNLRLSRWQPGWRWLLLYILFAFSWLHSFLPLMEGSAIVLVALLVTAFFLALRSGHDELAGLALAFATIIPTSVILLFGYVVVWAIFQRRWILLVWIFGSLGLLTAGAMLFIQDWPLQWIRTLLDSTDPLVAYTPSQIFATWWPGLGSRLGWVLTVVLGLILLAEWWMATRRVGFTAFFWTACLTLVASSLLGIPTTPVNHLLLFIPLVLVWAVWAERMVKRGWLVILITMVLLITLPWAIFISGKGTEVTGPLPFAQLLLPTPILLLVGLYWIRWWAVRPVRTVMDELRLRGDL